MKKGCIVLILLLSLLFVNMGFAATSIDSSRVILNIQNMEPLPVEPGQNILISVSVHNEGTEEAENLRLKPEIEKPFTLKRKDEGMNASGVLCSGCKAHFVYELSVSTDTVSGMHNFDLKLNQDGRNIKSKEVSINVKGKPDIIFRGEPVKEKVQPKGKFTTPLEFSNVGTDEAKNIKIDHLSDKFIKLGGNLKFIKTLHPGDSKIVNLTFNVREDVEPNIYKIPISINYEDPDGDAYSNRQNFGINVVHVAEMGVQNLKVMPSNEITSGDNIDLQMRIENTGEGNAKNVKVQLDSNFEGIKKAYLGNLESDNDRPAVFSLVADELGEQIIKVTVSYTDGLGSHEIVKEIEVDVGPSLRWVYIAGGAVVLLLFSFIYYKRMQDAK